MAASIIPRLIRGRLHFRTADALFPAFAQAASAWIGADVHRVDMAPPLQQQTRPPLRRCDDCQLDLGRDVLSALRTQVCDIDLAVVSVLETAVNKINDARESIERAIYALPERLCAHAELHEALAGTRVKLREMQGGVA